MTRLLENIKKMLGKMSKDSHDDMDDTKHEDKEKHGEDKENIVKTRKI